MTHVHPSTDVWSCAGDVVAEHCAPPPLQSSSKPAAPAAPAAPVQVPAPAQAAATGKTVALIRPSASH